MSEVQQQAVSMHTGAVVNGVQTQAEVLMQRHTHTGWPTASQALARWEALCKAMGAEDHVVPLQAMVMNPTTGGFFNENKRTPGHKMPHGVIPTRTALGHLLGFVADKPPEAVSNLEYYPPDVRAMMWQAAKAKTPARNVVMRTAIQSVEKGTLAVRAVTSEIHSQGNGDDLALIAQFRRLPEAVLNDARLRVIKEWDYTHVEMVLPSKVKEVRAGIVINGRINLKNSETKGGSFEAQVGTMNLVCLNGMIGGGSNSTVSVKHVGDIRTRMKAGIVTVIDLVDIYLEEFFEAYKTPLRVTQADAIARTVAKFKLPETTGVALAALWNVDGERGAGQTVAGLANALTRHAQSLPVEKAIAIEEAAGKVVSGVDFL